MCNQLTILIFLHIPGTFSPKLPYVKLLHGPPGGQTLVCKQAHPATCMRMKGHCPLFLVEISFVCHKMGVW